MKLLLSSLQLASLCALSSWSVSSELVVRQSEDITVVEGDAVNISCCTEAGRKTVTWLKNQNDTVKKEMPSTNSCSFLNIENITKDQEGTYFCNVQMEIPMLTIVSGNGTVLTVKYKNESSTNDKKSSIAPPLYAVMGLAPVLLICGIAVICVRRRRVQAARVIYEVPHFDSETPEMDKDSTGSRGSSQWCQVPVYESFDYFEHTEGKKSG